jgi:hypothetical protein
MKSAAVRHRERFTTRFPDLKLSYMFDPNCVEKAPLQHGDSWFPTVVSMVLHVVVVVD